MTQSKSVGQSQNALHELGYKIFLDRYALKDMTRQTLAVGDTVIVVVDSKTGQREVGEITALDLPKITVRLLDGSEVTRDIEHVDKPIETAPEQMMDRVARGIAEAEKTPEKQSEWQQKFRWLLDGWKFIPGGRILTGAGTDQELTYYNCMPPSQEVLTADGYKPIADIRVGDLVVTHRNRLRPVRHKFERETEELIYSINPKKIGFDSLRVTGEHKLPVMRGEWRDNAQNYNPVWIPASELRVGDYIALSFNGQPQSEQVLITREIALQQSGVAVQFAPAPIAEDEFEIAGEFEGLRWSQVDEITTENYRGVVMDMEVEEDHSFVSAGVVVSNCYVIPSPRDSRGGIIETLRQMTEIMSRGGGVGINISSLRPRHAYVKGVNGRSSGSVSWGALYSFVTGLIEQGGSRRGALMLILNDWHPDVFDFINSKRQMGQITNANISVGVSDKLMEAVKADADWTLMFPDTSDPDYDEAWDGDLDKWIADGRKVLPYRTVKAAELWNAMIESAWASAEPGVWFRERSNKMANSWYFNPLISTNPCVTGETLVSTEHGYTPARDLQVGMKIRTPAGLKPIEKIYNNGVQKIYRVTLSDGGFIDATADHKLKVVRKKRYEWIAVSDLNIGDKVLVMPNESFGSCRRLPDDALKYIDARGLKVSDYFDRDIGFLMGVVLGDGTLRQIGYSNSYSNVCKIAFGAGEPEWLTHIEQKIEGMGIHTHKTTAQKDIAYPNGTVATHQAITMDCYKLGTLLIKLGMEANTKAPEKSINPEFMSLDREFLAGLLDGLFSTDGGIDSSKANPMLRFHTSSFELAQQVRLLLLQFGIHGRVYKAKRKKDLMYDGRSMYGTGVKYDVLVMNEGIPRFYSEIGLSHPEKMRKLRDIAENTYFMGGTWLADVRSVEDTGREEEVFDVYEPDTVTWVTNGYVSFDCGEQPLGAFSVCNLGAIHLGKFYNAETRDVAWDDLRDAVRYAVRFLDNVIDSTPYFFEENARIQGMERRVGLGTMGIAELMVKLGVRYGSEESLKLIDDVYKLIAVEAYSMSAQIAAEKGAFPAFDAEKFLQSGYMQGMPEDVRALIQQNGIRNVTLLTQAPTGTTGTMANTSTGVEPFFSWVYYRKSRLGLHEEQVPLVKAWREQNPDATELPDYFVTAMELSPDEHVRVQAAFQRWVDSAISKTANVPNHYTVEQVSDLYKYMYELGCKGGTIYRDGSRDEQVLMLKGDERAESEMEKVKARQDKTDAAPDDDDTDAPASPHRVFPRPVKLTGVTANCPTPFGTAYVTMNVDEHGYPFEVFITAPGKAGSDLQADAEGLGRMISLSLRTTEPHNRREMLKLIIEQLRDIGGSRAVGFGPNRVISLPDSVARALEDHFFTIDQPQQLSLPMGNGNGQHTPHEMQPVSQALNGTAHDSHEASGMMSGADLCPSCGTISLIRAEGCRKCLTCGYSEC